MICNCFGVLNRCKGRTASAGQTHAQEIVRKDFRFFSYNTLRSATENFHPSTRIGRGGYGVVHRGILRDGTEVAIKSLSMESRQGTKEFITEVGMIINIRHPNLVQLIGCCVEENHRILVYEFVENNSLASSLLGSRKYINLDWPKRAAICLGTASGLAFLHEEAEPNIVHRDIKASNILLDGNFHPKIGDFGLAKLFPDNVTHVSTQVAGTMGYLAPEYALMGQLTKKADVYSFGILMLEIISGRRSSNAAFGQDFLGLVEWVWKLKEEDKLLDIVDPALKEFDKVEVLRFIKVALFCTQSASQQRPAMKQVVKMLSKEVHLNEKLLTEPGVYRWRNSRLCCDAGLEETSSSQVGKLNQSVNPSVTSTRLTDAGSMSEIIPR
ncbi:Kinase family protein [Quillaja saponaria]|uniref:Kinase family protein n=1 Tax=Quillaja saponaria TaxID=32244 RepID=A0AAD7LNC4_QUISA|nr:Kinase family protein [Quillaja saponaria]